MLSIIFFFCIIDLVIEMEYKIISNDEFETIEIAQNFESEKFDTPAEEFPEEEKVLIQGIIDVFFIEDNQIVLLDYVTKLHHLLSCI